MSVFNIEEPEVNEHENLARGILLYGNQVANQLVTLFRNGKNMLWNRTTLENGDQFTVADAQAVIDAMGANAIPLFTLTAALGQFIALKYPGSLTEEDLASPVSYTIVDGRIVLDPEARYPTEPEVEEEGEEEGEEE